MLKEQVQAYLTLLHHNKLWRIIILALFAIISYSCVFEENKEPFQVVCNAVIAQSEIDSPNRGLGKISFLNDGAVNIWLEQVDPDFSITYNTYQWNLLDQSVIKVEEKAIKFPLPCNCDAKVIDESPDGKWQIIDTKIIRENDRPRYQRWLISQNNHYELHDARDWSWSADGQYFSYKVLGHSYAGSLNLVNLETLDLVWTSYEDIGELGDIPEGFLKPVAFNYNIAFSTIDKTYWYRAWFREDQNKIYVYDPIAQRGKVETIENIRSAIWSSSFNQLLFLKSDDEYITIVSEDGLISAKIPYELYLEIDGEGLESELTHTNFQISPQGNYLVFPKGTQMYALECNADQ